MQADDDRLLKLLQELGVDEASYQDFEPEWKTLGELGRASVEAMTRLQAGTARVIKSFGSLRIHGDGVTGHSADLDAVGSVMTLFQSLVTAIGAVIDGHGASRGRVPQAVIHDTQLSLTAQPAPGSIILSITPKADEMAIAYPQGESLFGYEYPKIVLADESMDQLIKLLSAISTVDIEPFIDMVKEAGPRQAATLKALLKRLADSDFDVDVTWEEPDKPTRRVTLTSEEASYAYYSIETHNADSYEEDITGEIRTISTTKRLEIIPDGQDENGRQLPAVYIKRGELSDSDLAQYSVMNHVTVHVRTTPEIKPGDVEPKLVREALSISRIEPML